MAGCHFDLFLETVMAMDKTCMIVIGVVGGVALLAILAAIAFCITFVMFYRKSQAVADSSKKTPADPNTPDSAQTPVDSSEKRVMKEQSTQTSADADSSQIPTDGSQTPVDSSDKRVMKEQSTQTPTDSPKNSSKTVIAENNVILNKWQAISAALEEPIRDFAYRKGRFPNRGTLGGTPGMIFGDIETLRNQNPRLTSSLISIILDLWLQYGPGGTDAIANTKPDFTAKIDEFLAIPALNDAAGKQYGGSPPAEQIRNLVVNALAYDSNYSLDDKKSAVQLYKAYFAVRSANCLLFALRISNNSSCGMTVSAFDMSMSSVGAYLKQAQNLMIKFRDEHKSPHKIYGDKDDPQDEVYTPRSTPVPLYDPYWLTTASSSMNPLLLQQPHLFIT